MRQKTLDRLNSLDSRTSELATIANLPDPATSATAPGAKAPTVDERLELLRIGITGQPTPIGPPMQNRPVALRVFGLEDRVNLLEPRLTFLEQARLAQQQVDALQQQMLDQLLSGATATSQEVAALRALLNLARAAQVASDARQTAAELRLAALEAKDTLQASAIEANRLELVKNAAAAQKTANDDAAALLVLQGKLDTAQATATAAQAAAAANATALAGKLDASAVQRFTVATPAASLVVGTPYAVPVTLPKAWANGNYLVFLTKASGSTLLNVQLSDTAKTGAGFNLTMQTTGLATVAVGASSAEVLAIQLS